MINTMKLLTFGLLAALTFACGNNKQDVPHAENDFVELREVSAASQAPLVNEETQTITSKKVIKTGQIHFQTESISKEYDKIKTLLSNHDSYISSENESNSGYRISYDISIRVASKSYDSLFNQLSRLSNKVEFKSSYITDVTERYYDLKTRIKNKKLLEDKYIALLKRATTIKDILEIERSINQIRNEIETAEGSFRYLSKQVSYSSIQLNFYEILPDGYITESFGSQLINSISQGWQGFLYFLVALVGVWPFIIVLVLGFYAFKKIRKRIKKDK